MIERGNKTLIGLKIDLPNAPLLLLIYKDVIIGCGYLSKDAMEKFGNAACIVTGVRTFEDVLNARIRELTTRAAEKGAKINMKVSEFIDSL